MINEMRPASPRILAIAAIVCFAPVAVTFAFAPNVWWADYPGILFHLALFLLVAQLPAPEWARAAGYGWLVLDVATSVQTLNNVPHAMADPVRLGGHVFAGMWIMRTSASASPTVKIIGLVTGLWLFAFSFVSPFVPQIFLAPASLSMLAWLCVIAWQNGVSKS